MPRIKSMIRPGSHWDEVHFSNHVKELTRTQLLSVISQLTLITQGL